MNSARQRSLWGSSPIVTSVGNASAARSKSACSAVARSTLSIEVSAPSSPPAAIRCWGAGDRARRGGGGSGARLAGADEIAHPAVQPRAPLPQGRAALVGEQVHGERPALALLAD